MLGEAIRKYSFWTLDFLNQSITKKHYNEIKDIINGGSIQKSDLGSKIDALLKHATNTTEYYKQYRGINKIKDFPIIDKNIIKENQDRIMSKEHMNSEELHYMSTSGSTGTPLTIAQDKNKRKRVLAEIIYFGELCGYNLGDRNTYLRVWTEKNKKSKLGTLKQNIVMIDISKLDEESLDQIRITLKEDKNIKCILGYAGTLDVLSKYLLEKKDTPNMFGVKIVISGAEVLSEITRDNLKKVFGCNVVSRYSNQENGILAQELINSNYFIINNASYFIEFLKIDSNEEAKIGELSRVIVTDLYNYATPMIRYDTGDLAIVENHEYYGKVIKSIQGRKRDFIYNTTGGLLSPSAITFNMWKYNKIKQYQLIQEDSNIYRLKLNVTNGIYKDENIIITLKHVLGADAEIIIEHVEGIPFLKSGKFQVVVCNYR